MNNNNRVTYLVGLLTALYFFYALLTSKPLTSEFMGGSLLFMAFAFLLAIIDTFPRK